MDRNPKAPAYVRWVARTLEEEGYETWAVGGAIRDTLLGLPSGDWDLATRATPKVVRRLFPRTVPVGIEHGTIGVLTRQGTLVEVTTFRKDVETFGRRAVVEFADTLAEDLSRRDFTVNAIAWHPIREEFQDPFQGRQDLEDRILQTVGVPQERFAEDYLRVLRGLRFSARYSFRIRQETWEALCAAKDRLGILSPERVREELMKILADGPRPSGALALYHVSGVLGALYPELSAVAGCSRPGSEEDLWIHSLLLMDLIPDRRPLLRLMALLHGLGVPENSGVSEEAQALRGRDRAAALMTRLRFSNAAIKAVTEAIHLGLEPPLGIAAPPELRRWLHRAGPHRLAEVARIWFAKARLDRHRWGRDPQGVLGLVGRLRKELQGGAPLRAEELAVDGRDLISLGLKPGPHFGEILEGLMERVLDEPTLNQREILLELVKETLSEKG
ncbi:CCA tRNA nucleotidyltransferase [Gemmatimonadota bacterium]